MSDSGASNKLWMGIAAVAVIGLVISIATRPEAPKPEAEAKPAPSPPAAPPPPPAAPEAPAVEDKPDPTPEPDMGMAVQSPLGATVVYVPEGASPVQAPPRTQGDRGFEGQRYKLTGVKDVAKLLRTRISETGEEQLRKYLDATYSAMTTEPASPVTTRISVAAGKGIHLAYPQSLQSMQLNANGCRETSDGTVLDCLYLDRLKLWLYRAAHDAMVLLPLDKPPYKLAKAEEVRAAEDAMETNSKRYTYDILGTDMQAVVLQEVDSLKPMGVYIRSKTLEKMGIDSMRCTLTGWEEFDGVPVATRWQISWRLGEHTPGENKIQCKPYVIHVTAVTPSAAVASSKLSAATKIPSKLRVVPRRALTVFGQPTESFEKAYDAWLSLRIKVRPFRLTLPHERLVVVGVDGTLTAAMDPRAVTRAMGAPGFMAVAAHTKVARKVVKVELAKAGQAMANFVNEVRGAGHKPIAGPTLVRCLRWPPLKEDGDRLEAGPYLVELQVPVE